jgi:hypothetical protein
MFSDPRLTGDRWTEPEPARVVRQLRGISRISKDSTMSPISMFW